MARISPPVAITTACMSWALGTVLTKSTLSSIPPISLLVLQLLPSVAALWLLVLVGGVQPAARRLLVRAALLGLLNPGLSYTLNIFGLLHSTASIATLLWAAEPILILGLAWAFLGERLSASLLAAIAVGACGVILVSGLTRAGLAGADGGHGAALILAGVLCCAIYTVVARNLAVDPLLAVALQQTMALAWTASVWPVELRNGAWATVLTLSPIDMLQAVTSGLLYYAVAYWLYLVALRLMPASVAGGFLNLVPLFGIATAYLVLGERLSPAQWAGGILILLAALSLLRLQGVPSRHRPNDEQLDQLALGRRRRQSVRTR